MIAFLGGRKRRPSIHANGIDLDGAGSFSLNSEFEQVVLVLLLVLIVAPKLFIEPGAKAKVVNAFERERPPDCE